MISKALVSILLLQFNKEEHQNSSSGKTIKEKMAHLCLTLNKLIVNHSMALTVDQ